MSFLYFFDLLGTFVFAISGALLGQKKDMDIYGIFVLSLAVAVGGGTVRDMMMGNTPPFVLKDPNYLIVTVVAVVVVLFFSRYVHKRMSLLLFMDAIGLGVFTVIGVTKGIFAGVSWYACVLLGILTCTGGGMIRDILAGDIPFVLRKEVYASASLVGGLTFLLLDKIGAPANLNAFMTAVLVTAIRMLTLTRNMNLPKSRI